MVTASAPAHIAIFCGSRVAISMMVASAEGPAMSGMASGTMSGSPCTGPNVPSELPNTMRIAIMKRMTPP